MISRNVFSARHALVLGPLLALLSGVSACKNSAAASTPTEEVHVNEAWISEAQIAARSIKVEVATEQDVDDTVLASGKVTFDDLRVSHIFSPVSGRVTRIDAELGQRIKKGQSLAVIESPDIGVASSDVGKAQADLIAAEHDYAREKELFAAHAASQKDFEQSEDNYRKAKSELERARAKASLFRAGSAAGDVTQGFVLRSGIDGEVISRFLSPGAEVQGQYGGGTAQELFTIGELDRVWVVADVFEMDLARVKVGSKAVVRLVAYRDRTFDGKVDYVAGTLDPQTRTARIRCIFDNADRALKPEMFATVAISVEERKALAIPREAVLRMGDETVVFIERGVTKDGRRRFERMPVKVDEGEGSKWLPVLGDTVKAGDRVVTQGAIVLSAML